MAYLNSFLFVALLALASLVALAHANQRKQDFCVATNDPNGKLFVNGRFCKNTATVTPNDFYLAGLNIPQDTNNRLRINVTRANVDTLPGLNTLDVSLIRNDFGPYGLNPPHYHPRASEISLVITGKFYVGFVSVSATNNNVVNILFAKVFNEGDVFVFPQGLMHFQFNMANAPGLAYSALSSEDSNDIYVAEGLYGAVPSIAPNVLAQGFRMNIDEVMKNLNLKRVACKFYV